MIPAQDPRRAPGRGGDPTARGPFPARPVRPVRLVTLQGSRGQIPSTPAAACAMQRHETYGIWGGTDLNPDHHQEDVA